MATEQGVGIDYDAILLAEARMAFLSYVRLFMVSLWFLMSLYAIRLNFHDCGVKKEAHHLSIFSLQLNNCHEKRNISAALPVKPAYPGEKGL